MIVPMRKVYVVSRAQDRQKLLEALRQLGVVHVEPIEPERAVAAEQQIHALQVLNTAVRMLSQETPSGEKPDLEAFQAAEETAQLERESIELQSRLSTLYRQIEELEVWGDVRLEQFRQLKEAGLTLGFFAVAPEQVSQIQGDCVTVVADPYGAGSVLVAAVSRQGDIEAPQDALAVELPSRDRPTIRQEAAEVDAKLKENGRRLSQLAHLLGEIQTELSRREADAEFTIASRSGMEHEDLYAIQGWVPVEQADKLGDDLEAAGVPAGIETLEPDTDEQPPTLVRYPRWAKPIQSLFGVLGTTPGYREYDLAPFFMLAMPVFTAMLVGDAGYGLIFTLVGALFYGRMERAGAKPAAQLILSFGVATFIWGMLTGNVFGVGPGQVPAGIGSAWKSLAVLWRPEAQAEAGRNLIMQVSFTIGLIHLSMAHLRQAIGLLPDQRGIAEVGWIGFIFGMFTLVWLMFFGPLIPPMATLWILVISWIVIVLFCSPDRNPLKRVTFGVLGNLMSIPGAFGDMLSYIRLMAVGLASYYIASAFNGLALEMSEATLLALPGTILVLLFAHGLNIGLCLVAIFAHGVRLNMLEFSTNAGVQWAGHPYAPFSLKTVRNEGES
jgi:V/A-type H+-transporting ATPase subunit I